MFRSMSSVTGLVAAAVLALPAAAPAQAQDHRPVVVVLPFTNSSIGAGSAEFAGIATGVQDMLITDMAANPKIRLVDRANIDAVVREHNMVKGGQIDPETAVRLGKIMGAQYMVVGGFISDGHGTAVLMGHTVDVETTQISNPEKITGKSDDVLAIIAQLSTKLGANMKLDVKPGRRVGDAGTGDAGAKPAAVQSGAAQSGAPAETKPAVETYAYRKPVSEKAMKAKLDVATMKIYSNALDEMDKKNNAKAAALFKQVTEKFPEFEPATRNYAKVTGNSGN